MSLTRKTPLKRTGPITRDGAKELRRSGIKKKRTKRTQAKLDREYKRKYGSQARVQAIKAEPCAVPGCTRTPCDNAHVKGGGMGRKAGWQHIVPLCGPQLDGFPGHHYIRDHVLGSNEAFEREYGVNLEAVAGHYARTLKP